MYVKFLTTMCAKTITSSLDTMSGANAKGGYESGSPRICRKNRFIQENLLKCHTLL